MTACQRCGRALEDPASIARQLGPECIHAAPTLRQQVLTSTDPVLNGLRARLEAGRRLTPRMRRLTAYVLAHPERFNHA